MAPTSEDDETRQSKDRESPPSTAPKRHKKSLEDDLICPITHELPFVPVMAEDGRVYERSAIEEYFKKNVEGEVKSPMTGEMIGKGLLPAP